MLNHEIIKFEIFLGSSYQTIAPEVKICLDGTVKHYEKLVNPQTLIKFEHLLDFDSVHKLEITRTGKTIHDSQQIAWLENLKIDGIDVKNIVLDCSLYYPIFPEPWASEQRSQGIVLEYPVASGTHWGHNGTWELEFTSPFYKFLFDRTP